VKRSLVVIALVAVPLLADDVYLKGGGQITGEIVKQTAESVTVDVGGGSLTVATSRVVRIEKGRSDLQEYRERAKSIPAGDAEAWRQLARWATSGTLGTQASEAYSQVVAIVPDDPEANAALGRVQLDGRWVTEEESFRARGFVKFEGEWMTPGERQTILQDRQASQEADRQSEQARMQAEQQAKSELAAREAAEHEAFVRSGLPRLGDPVVWGWGYGPTSWPSATNPQPMSAVPIPVPGQASR
jgi:hypothetical protein